VNQRIKRLYGDVEDAGGLVNILRPMLSEWMLGTEIHGFGTWQNYAHIQLGERTAQVFLSLMERRFMVDFWKGRQQVARGSSASLEEVKASIGNWLAEGNVDNLTGTFPFVTRL